MSHHFEVLRTVWVVLVSVVFFPFNLAAGGDIAVVVAGSSPISDLTLSQTRKLLLGEQQFWNFYDWIYENQEQIDPGNLQSKVIAWAEQKGIDTVQLGRCIDTKATEAEVNQSIAEGHSLGLKGTPTLFINGRKIGGLQWPDLQLVINQELDYLAKK